jgi:predicted AlkP superfamily phosphohydrolase/phosphomutase
VPVTYPVQPINGIVVSGFLAPQLNAKAVYPASLLPRLIEMGYRVDTDPLVARQDRDRALDDIRDALDKRLKVFLHLLESEPWDLFFAVVMETDRLHHFFFRQMEAEDPRYGPQFWEIYGRIDAFLGQVRSRLGPRDRLVLMSDHGFCTIREEVFYNRWLAQAGYLQYAAEPAKGVEHLHPASTAYNMDPGRIFLNVRGRECTGRVTPGREYEAVRDELIVGLETLEVPANGASAHPVLKAYRREELYRGPYVDQAADIIIAPVNGYDPKGTFQKDHLLHQDAMMVGMHTYDDAFVYVGGGRVDAGRDISLLDVAPTLLAGLNQPIPHDFDGTALL